MIDIKLLADIQGNWSEIEYGEGIIIHSGNFGFWDVETILNCDFNYLKQLISFSTIIPSNIVDEINEVILINQIPSQEVIQSMKNKILPYFEYLDNFKGFEKPVYTIFGPMDDPRIIRKIQTGQLVIPNLFLIDHLHNYIITQPNEPDIKIYGISGKFKFIKLFNNGDINEENDIMGYEGRYDNLISGEFGELWINLLQISEFYQSNYHNKSTINFFVCYNSIMKTPILEYLAMITNANFTVSSSLHFKFPIIGNEMSFLNSIENFKLKFSKFRIKFGEFFKIIQKDLISYCNNDEDLINNLEIGLEIFDKIPIINSNKIISLSLKDKISTNESISKINELYFENFYNLWHFNLCDFKINNEFNFLTLNLADGKVNLKNCNSFGFDFNFKIDNDTDDDDDFEMKEFKNRSRRGRGRGRGRGRAVRGRGFR
ncbi:hypothetical protein CLIB1444_06S03796 [[Candida] jaroonii]|uniref:Uncharacterized protein n=1 Tax=[Candida] jaroonii TaxID=467808 RepID=A0ACA9Y909_9ASCO|nr:hypothetical protein CLIB1444_06S03796 [[Candida] jaroonii]